MSVGIAAHRRAGAILHGDGYAIGGGGSAGKSLDVVVTFKIEPKWHIYWKNPGDSGEATKIDWKLPEGWKADGLRYQVPHAIDVGCLVNYGYEREATLIARLAAPADYDGSPVNITGEASYLICKEACIPGSRKFAFDLPGKAMNEQSLSAARSLMPTPMPAPVKASYEDDKLVLRFGMAKVKCAYFFPENSLLANHSATQTLKATASGNRLEIPLSEYLTDRPKKVAGVLRVTHEDASVRGYDVELKP